MKEISIGADHTAPTAAPLQVAILISRCETLHKAIAKARQQILEGDNDDALDTLAVALAADS